MLICVVADVMGEENNGTVIATMNLIRALEKNNTVRVLCADQSKKGVENYYVTQTRNLWPFNGFVDKVGVKLAKADMKIINEALDGVDYCHIMLPFTLGNHAVKVCKERNIPTSAGFHMQAENFTSYIKLNKVKPLNKFIYKHIYRKLYSKVDGIHYPTKFIRDIFEHNIKRKTNGHVISNGVNSYVEKRNVEKPDNLKDKIVILTTGRYAKEKSQDTLIKAVYYSKYKDKIQLILGGKGVKEKYYRKLSKNLPIEPIFSFYSRKEIIDVLNYSDLYVHPADAELEGISCIEAIACGKLTIVSNSILSATKEFAVDDKCIFKRKDPKDLARIIDFWIENPELKKEYEAKYLESSVAYNQDECMVLMEDFFKEIYDKKIIELNKR